MNAVGSPTPFQRTGGWCEPGGTAFRITFRSNLLKADGKTVIFSSALR